MSEQRTTSAGRREQRAGRVAREQDDLGVPARGAAREHRVAGSRSTRHPGPPRPRPLDDRARDVGAARAQVEDAEGRRAASPSNRCTWASVRVGPIRLQPADVGQALASSAGGAGRSSSSRRARPPGAAASELIATSAAGRPRPRTRGRARSSTPSRRVAGGRSAAPRRARRAPSPRTCCRSARSTSREWTRASSARPSELGALDHTAAGGVQDPVPHVLLLDAVILEQAEGQLFHHRRRDAADLLLSRTRSARPGNRSPCRAGARSGTASDDPTTATPSPSVPRAHRAGAVGEDRVGHRALQGVVQVRRSPSTPPPRPPGRGGRDCPEVVVRLLERDDRAGAARVAHVDPLDVFTELQRTDEMRVEARAQAPGAGRGREEVDVARRPARAPEDVPHRRRTDLDGAPLEALVELVDALIGRERLGVEIEVAAIDLAVREESGALPLVAGKAEQRVLIPAIRRARRWRSRRSWARSCGQDTLAPIALSTRGEHYQGRFGHGRGTMTQIESLP